MLSIKQMKRLSQDFREGKEVPRWVKYVLEPQMATTAKFDMIRTPEPKKEAEPAEEQENVTIEALLAKLREAPTIGYRASVANELASRCAEISDSGMLAEVAVSCNHKYLSHALVERVGNDIESLFFIVNNAAYEPAAEQALGKLCSMVGSIESIDILNLIGERSDVLRVKIETAGKLAKHLDSLGVASLKIVFMNSQEEVTKRKALEKLSEMAGDTHDAGALKIVAVYSTDDEARRLATGKISHLPQALKTVATCSLYQDTRLAALDLIEEPETVKEIAICALDDDVAAAAAGKFSENRRMLAQIYDKAPRKAARDVAVTWLLSMASELDTESELKIVVLNGDASERRMAIDKLAAMVGELRDRHSLIYVAIWAQSSKERKQAMDALSTDKEALELVAEMSEFEDSKHTATRLLSGIASEASRAN